ncbi:MAG: glycerol-3-phosphate dehydrogenase/oxidase [Myxococcales bacterium]|nr:glycerol-3-phosphate dehydrogenase/oxidase [Myxococcales bacterium]MCB9641502.1 glycerol-3-phosphate dehydrogenase/oxidase [Myxococcales bacterium]
MTKLRTTNIRKLSERVFDVLILGAGINGAVSASALSGQGASVALIDKGDFASFTSQESSNLVWGGIKYLEGLEFGLVRKLCKSRNHLMRHYPSSVQEIRFFTTLDKDFRHSRSFLFAGGLFYWMMGSFFTEAPRLLSTNKIREEEPSINVGHSQGGFEYSDAYLADNDARFVFGFVREALDHGATVANYVEAIDSKRVDGLWHTRIKDHMTGKEQTIRSKVLLNACGPFADRYNEKSHQKTQHKHLFSKGIHLIVNRITPSRKVLAFFANDGRLFFMIPMGPKTCIGTTDTRVEELPPHVTDEDRDFVLDNINQLLQLETPLSRADIIAERCGVRPLVVEPRKEGQDQGDWASLSRKHVIEVDHNQHHISIFGGKLTDCLNVGEEISAEVRRLGVRLPYAGNKWYGEPEALRQEFFHQARLMGLDQMASPGLSEPLSQRLWRRYTARSLYLLEEIRQDPTMAEVLIEGTEYTRCELYHVARHEMIVKLDDFLRRRSKIALITRPEAIKRTTGMREACRILFGEEADMRFEEYFLQFQKHDSAEHDVMLPSQEDLPASAPPSFASQSHHA